MEKSGVVAVGRTGRVPRAEGQRGQEAGAGVWPGPRGWNEER